MGKACWPAAGVLQPAQARSSWLREGVHRLRMKQAPKLPQKERSDLRRSLLISRFCEHRVDVFEEQQLERGP